MGAAAAATRLRDTPPLPPALVAEERVYRWRGADVAYAEAGDPEDPDLLLVHGLHAVASTQEFHHVLDALAERYHVVAPDLPGFGRSDRPALAYTGETYRDFLADLTDDILEDPVCLATSLSGALAAEVAEDRFSALVLVCPTDRAGTRRPWLRTLFRTPVVGDLLYGALTSRPALRYWGAREGYEDPAALTADEVDYQHRSARQPGARLAPASFVGGFIRPERDLRDVLATTAVPTTLVWGREATRTPLAVGRGLAAAGDTALVVVDETRLLPHAERPAAFLRGLRDADALPRLEAE